MSNTTIFLLILAVVVIFFALTRGKKKRRTLPEVHTTPKPNPGKPKNPPAPPAPMPGEPVPDPVPEPPPESPEVLIDRNGKRPGDAGYDPRIDEPRDKFSPAPPYGAYYGQGPFDPDVIWFGPDGYHWTDRHGVHHGS